MRAPSALRASIVLLAAAAALAVGAQAAPAPGGHDQALRGLIEDTTRGEIRYETLTPDLAKAVRPQAALAKAELSALGALKSVTFVSIDQSGAERYRTIFERGALEWAFSVDGRGLIDNAKFRPLSSGL